MSMQDPIADLLTRIRNGFMAKKSMVVVPHSKVKASIINVLHQEGYVGDFKINEISKGKSEIQVNLKYYKGNPVIRNISRVSRPGLRVYKNKDSLPKVLGGFGISIVSTPRGILSDKKAKELSQGGEVICCVE